VGVVGRDRARNLMLREFKKRRIADTGLVCDNGRHTTIKTRVVAHHQQVVRVDREHRQDIPVSAQKRVIQTMERLVPKVDAVLIEDYNKGLITSEVLEAALELARRHKKIVTVDPKFNHFLEFRGVTLFKPNIHEAERAMGTKISNEKDIVAVGKRLLEKISAGSVLLTAGEKGMYLFTENGKWLHIPTAAREVYDVSGAGDTVISVCTLALCAGASPLEAAIIANHAAGVEVSKFGVAAVTFAELRESLRSW